MTEEGDTDIPIHGIHNEALDVEVTPETQKKIFPRSDTTLTQVDLDILSAQVNVKTAVTPG